MVVTFVVGFSNPHEHGVTAGWLVRGRFEVSAVTFIAIVFIDFRWSRDASFDLVIAIIFR